MGIGFSRLLCAIPSSACVVLFLTLVGCSAAPSPMAREKDTLQGAHEAILRILKDPESARFGDAVIVREPEDGAGNQFVAHLRNGERQEQLRGGTVDSFDL